MASLKKVILNREDAKDAKILEVENENLTDPSACPLFSSRSLRLGSGSLVFSGEPRIVADIFVKFAQFVAKENRFRLIPIGSSL